MAQGELSLTDYWRILEKRKWEVFGTIALVVSATSLYLGQQVPVYRAIAKIKLQQAQPISMGFFSGLQSYENPVATESRVIESRAIADAVARQMEPQAAPEALQALVAEVQGSIGAEPIPETNIVNIIATGAEPERLARIANLAVEMYIAHNLSEKNKQARKVREFVESQLEQTEGRLRQTEDALKRMREEGRATGMAVTLQNRILETETELTKLRPKLTEVHPDIVRLKEQLVEFQQQLRGLPAAELEYARMAREIEVNEKTYRALRERLEEARLAEAEKIPDATVIERALVPTAPVTPPKWFGLTIGGVLGLLLGCVLAFVFETMDTSIGTIEDVEKLLQVPVLAVIPHISALEGAPRAAPMKKKKRKRVWSLALRPPPPTESRQALHVHYHPHSVAAETYRILKTNLKLGPERKVLMVTSAGPAEGKTTMICNLGLVLAQSGMRTLLISSDLRRPELDRIFGMEREAGLSEVIQGTLPFDRAVRGLSDFILGKFGFDETVKHPYLANLFVMTSGHHLQNSPSEVIGSKAMRDLLAAARAQFDVVLLDLPPLLPVADGLVLAPQVDGVMMIYQVGRISRGALLRAKTQLASVGATMVGVVLNHVRPEVRSEPQDYAYYAYQKRYAQRQAAGAGSSAEPPAPRA